MEIRRDHMISSPIGSASSSAVAWARDMPGVTSAWAFWAAATAMRRLRAASTVTLSPGAMTVVASRSSMIAGPATVRPGASAERACGERVAVVDRRVVELAVEVGRPMALQGRTRHIAANGARKSDLWLRGTHPDTERQNLDVVVLDHARGQR